jgi:branched-chain amino acid transport system ATP-binding protein
LDVEGLTAGYTDAPILHDVTVRVPHGTIVTIIGPNGAGKSTLLRAIFGILAVRQGTVRFAGRDISGSSPIDRIRMGMGFVPQGRCNFPNMTVRENLEMGAYLSKERGSALEASFDRMMELFPILREKQRAFAGTMSGGEQQILEMAMALVMSPKLLILDEPSIGLAPQMVEMVFQHLQSINHDGVTVLMVEQNARKALSYSDGGIVLSLGRVMAQAPADAILNDEDIRRLYLAGAPSGKIGRSQ